MPLRGDLDVGMVCFTVAVNYTTPAIVVDVVFEFPEGVPLEILTWNGLDDASRLCRVRVRNTNQKSLSPWKTEHLPFDPEVSSSAHGGVGQDCCADMIVQTSRH